MRAPTSIGPCGGLDSRHAPFGAGVYPLRVLAHLPPAPPEKPAFVILAPAEWRASLQPLVEARRGEFEVELAALEDVAAGEEGADAPERIKRFLWRAWRERRATHALLVGDAD